MNASEAWAERKRLGYSTLVERQMRDPEFRAGVEAEEGVIAQEVEARAAGRQPIPREWLLGEVLRIAKRDKDVLEALDD
jgi:hypothetical protein